MNTVETPEEGIKLNGVSVIPTDMLKRLTLLYKIRTQPSTCRYTLTWCKGKRCLCVWPRTTPWRHMVEGITVPYILNPGTRWRWVVSFTPSRFTLGEKALGTQGP